MIDRTGAHPALVQAPVCSKGDGDVTKQKCVKIPSDILQALARIPWLEYRARAVLFLLSKTEQDWTCLTLSDWSCGTGISQSHMSETLKRLVRQHILKRTLPVGGKSKPAKYGFNRHFERWHDFPLVGSGGVGLPVSGKSKAAEPEQNRAEKNSDDFPLVGSGDPSFLYSLALAFDSPSTKEEVRKDVVPSTKEEIRKDVVKGIVNKKKIVKKRKGLTWESDHWEGITPEWIALLSRKFPTLDVLAEIHRQEAYTVTYHKHYVNGERTIGFWLLQESSHHKGDENGHKPEGRNQRFTVANHTDADYDNEQDVIVADTARPQRLDRPTDTGLHQGTPSGS
jgi:hypothetical protein